MKKVLTGFVVLLLIITESKMILKKDSNKTASVNTEAIESTLVVNVCVLLCANLLILAIGL